MRQAQLKPEKRTAGNGWSTDPKVPATVPVPDCMGSDPGRHPADSNPNPAAVSVDPAAVCAVVSVNRNTALTNDVDRGMLTAHTAMNEPHPVDSSVAVAVHRKTELTDDADRNIASAASAIDTELTRSLCKLIGVVYCDINCSSSSESDCIRPDSIETDLHNPECSSVPAGTVVNAPLNVSPALSDTSLAQPHSARHDAQSPHSVPNSHSQLQGEYPPCLSSDVVRGDLSPPCYDGVNPKGLPSDSASPAQAGGKILGLVAAPLVGNAVSSPVAESADPSGKDSLVRMGPACHSIASQSGNQPDSQSEAHTALSAADGLCEPLDRQKSKRIWRSKFGSDPSCGCSSCTFSHSTPTLSFSISISVKPVPTFNWRAP